MNRTDNYFHNKSELREELYEWLEEYYMACNEPEQPQYRGHLNKEQYILFKCICCVLKIGNQPDRINYPYMHGYLQRAIDALRLSLRDRYPN